MHAPPYASSMSPRDPAKRRATYQDVIDAPENMIAEIIDGELVLMARPRARHANVVGALGRRIGTGYQDGDGGPGGWWILSDVEVALSDDLFVPDIAGWKRSRLPRLAEDNPFTVVPDWACEVLSPSTERLDRQKKMRTYAAHGVAHLWLVDPVRRQLEVYRRQEHNWLLLGVHADEDIVRCEPFDAIEIALARLWPDEAAGGPVEVAARIE